MNKAQTNMKANDSIVFYLGTAIFAVALVFSVFAIPVAHAQFDSGGGDSGYDVGTDSGFDSGGGSYGYDGSCCSIAPSSVDYSGITPSSVDYYATPSSIDYPDSNIAPSSIDYPDSTIAPSSIDYPSYYSSYPNYYSGASYASYPSYSYSPAYSTPSYYASTPVSNVINSGNTSVYAPSSVTDNTCTGSSCNTNIVSNPAPIINNVVTNPAPSTSVVYAPSAPVYYSPAPTYYPTPTYSYPSCTLAVTPSTISYGQPATISWSSSSASSGWVSMVGNVGPSGSAQITPGTSQNYTATFYGYNGQSVNCSAYVNIGAPIVYNQQPYITLSAVPYTGLDLGFWGTIAYWGFLVAWCLFAAYLIAVKRLQNKVARAIKVFLFGNGSATHKVAHTAPVSHATPAVHAPKVTHVEHAPAHTSDQVDEFILSQIHRAARA